MGYYKLWVQYVEYQHLEIQVENEELAMELFITVNLQWVEGETVELEGTTLDAVLL